MQVAYKLYSRQFNCCCCCLFLIHAVVYFSFIPCYLFKHIRSRFEWTKNKDELKIAHSELCTEPIICSNSATVFYDMLCALLKPIYLLLLFDFISATLRVIFRFSFSAHSFFFCLHLYSSLALFLHTFFVCMNMIHKCNYILIANRRRRICQRIF